MRIRMLGNHLDWENGKEYDVEDKVALALVSMGYAVEVSSAADVEEVE